MGCDYRCAFWSWCDYGCLVIGDFGGVEIIDVLSEFLMVEKVDSYAMA